jgi:hypothetical protein
MMLSLVEEAGATLSVTVRVPVGVAVMEAAFIIELRFRWSILIGFAE